MAQQDVSDQIKSKLADLIKGDVLFASISDNLCFELKKDIPTKEEISRLLGISKNENT